MFSHLCVSNARDQEARENKENIDPHVAPGKQPICVIEDYKGDGKTSQAINFWAVSQVYSEPCGCVVLVSRASMSNQYCAEAGRFFSRDALL